MNLVMVKLFVLLEMPLLRRDTQYSLHMCICEECCHELY